MPRTARLVVPGAPHHVTQRGNHQDEVFHTSEDRIVYLGVLEEQCEKAELEVLGFCLMTNHVHLVVVPHHEAAMAQALGRTHFRYANYFQARMKRSGHLWQNRYYSCPLSGSHLVTAMLYVEQNPVRAGLVDDALRWRWSSAGFHAGLSSEFSFPSQDWSARFSEQDWRSLLSAPRTRDEARLLEHCTYSGKPFGEKHFIDALSERFGRSLALRAPGRPRKERHAAGANC